ncbi:NlpC/P60 family protein [Glycomyces sp. TRM65418]|uniref:C40 family peptidase n=1 Tax=Glycomyces sp. TRM65418 TaxID=2867006 RepID=UPI001CE69F91|nr:C40 family peptidase [Glycomyces sp. TRM65418]MCC3764646.1 NlpC/P60 family protein [Glycomyces sp. TRM65418]QZD54308.1 C40 family peptidase [Glycomyces sp. TRM65418]
MKQSSVRRKWTSVAVIGGLLVASAGSGSAWAQNSPEDINDEIEAADEDLAAAVEEYNQMAQQVSDNREMIAETEIALAAAEEDLEALRDQLADYINSTYVEQGIGDTAMLLESGSPDAFVERLDRLNSANLYNFALMDDLRTASDEYTAQLDLLTDLQADLETEEAALEKTAEDLSARMEDLEEEWQTAAGEEVAAFSEYDLPRMTDDQYAVVKFALDQVGEPYVWGSAGPDSWDCSGLMKGAYAQIGISLPHNAAAQYNTVATISRDELQPGDFVFYNGLAHVGMYIGNGLIVHAPNSTTVVKIVELDHGNVYYGVGTLLH